MPTWKADLSALSIRQLSELTKKHQRTVVLKLREAGVRPVREAGNTIYYAPWEALPVLYGGATASHLVEKAKLDETKREMLELQIAEKRGELLDALDVQAMGAAIVSGITLRVMSLRNMAPEIRAAESDGEGAQILEDGAREALSEIARMGQIVGEVHGAQRADDPSVDGGREASAEANGQRVGRSGTEAIA